MSSWHTCHHTMHVYVTIYTAIRYTFLSYHINIFFVRKCPYIGMIKKKLAQKLQNVYLEYQFWDQFQNAMLTSSLLCAWSGTQPLLFHDHHQKWNAFLTEKCSTWNQIMKLLNIGKFFEMLSKFTTPSWEILKSWGHENNN